MNHYHTPPSPDLIVSRWQINPQWTLFLDRDGVINQNLKTQYVRSVEQFAFIEQVPDVIKQLRRYFCRILVVTNQQGIGKGLMTDEDLYAIFRYIQTATDDSIDGFFFCPHLAQVRCLCRKPNIGMALQARIQFPGLDLRQAIMVGDSATDIAFGKKLGMKTVFVTNNEPLLPKQIPPADLVCANLPEFATIFWNSLPA